MIETAITAHLHNGAFLLAHEQPEADFDFPFPESSAVVLEHVMAVETLTSARKAAGTTTTTLSSRNNSNDGSSSLVGLSEGDLLQVWRKRIAIDAESIWTSETALTVWRFFGHDAPEISTNWKAYTLCWIVSLFAVRASIYPDHKGKKTSATSSSSSREHMVDKKYRRYVKKFQKILKAMHKKMRIVQFDEAVQTYQAIMLLEEKEEESTDLPSLHKHNETNRSLAEATFCHVLATRLSTESDACLSQSLIYHFLRERPELILRASSSSSSSSSLLSSNLA